MTVLASSVLDTRGSTRASILWLTSEQRAADQDGGEKLRQAAQEEELEVEVAVGEPREEEHQGLKEEVEVEMVVGEQSEQEEQVPLEVVEELVGRLSDQEEQWGQEEVIVVTVAGPLEVEEQVEVEEQEGLLESESLVVKEPSEEVEVVLGSQERESPSPDTRANSNKYYLT